MRYIGFLAVSCLIAACSSSGGSSKEVTTLEIDALEVLTDSVQAGHPIQIRTTVMTDDEAEDVAVTYYLDPVGGQGEKTVLDSHIEDVVRATVESETEPGKMIGHEFVAEMTVPKEVMAGNYHVYAELTTFPTSGLEEARTGVWDPVEEGAQPVPVGDDLVNTPDLVIGDVIAKTNIILLGIENPDEGQDPAANHWTGTVEVTAFGGAQVEDVEITALLEIPGKPLRPIQLWNTHEHVQVWRNDGSGTFKDTHQRLRSSEANAIALGDLDGDGDLDLVAGNGHPDESEEPKPNRVWFNDGTGGFRDSDQSIGDGFTFAVALGDLDGDGDLDLVTGNADNGQGQPDRVWINEGRGFFSAGQELGAANTYGVALSDVDGDGDLDLVTAGDEHHLWINDGTGNFSDSGQNLGMDPVRAVAMGDVDGDDDPDLILGGPQRTTIWRNSGGAFADTGQDLGESQALALDDLDRDRDRDLASGLPGGGVQIFRNQGGVFTASGSPLGSDHAYAIAIGDVNADGLADVVVGNDGPIDIMDPNNPDDDEAIEEADRIWLNDGVAQDEIVFLEGQELGGSDTRAIALANIDQDEDLDLVSGNLGLPERIEGIYKDTLILPALAPNSPTRVQIDLHIPEEIEGAKIYDEIRDHTNATRNLRFNIIFCLDRFNDIPEHEASALDPLRSNDNCISHETIILPPAEPGETPNEVNFSNDSEATFGGKLIGIGMEGHTAGRLYKEGIHQIAEQKVPFTLFGWTLDVMRLNSDGRKFLGADRKADARHTLDLEFAGITVYSTSGEGPEDDEDDDETENVKISLSFSICMPPPVFELEFVSEEYQFGVKVERMGDGQNSQADPKNNSEEGQETETKAGEGPSKVNEGGGPQGEPGLIKVIPAGPIPLAIRFGGCGKIGFTVEVNPKQGPGDLPANTELHMDYRLTPLAELNGFVQLEFGFSFGILTAKAFVRAELTIVEYGYEIRALSTFVPNASAPGLAYCGESTFKVTEIFRSLKGQVFVGVEIGIKADIGIFKLEISFKWQIRIFKFKGIEQEDILLKDSKIGFIHTGG